MSPRLLGLQAIAHHLAPVLQRMWSSFHHPCWDIQLPAAPGEDVQGLSHPSQSFLCLQSLIFREAALPWSLPPLCFTLQFLWTWHGFFQGLGWGLCLSEGPLIATFLTVKMSIRYWWLSPSQSQHRQQTQSVELFVAHTGGVSQGDLLIDSQSSNMLLIASLVRTLPTAKLGLSN